jgi:hypothetical protein
MREASILAQKTNKIDLELEFTFAHKPIDSARYYTPFTKLNLANCQGRSILHSSELKTL